MVAKLSKTVTKTRCGGTMTESAFLAWVRSALRSKSLRWPPRNEALQLARKPYKGANKLQKWEYKCAICHAFYKGKDVIVDHHPKPAGSILSISDVSMFVNNLYCEVDNLRVLCSPCHDVHTLADKLGITFEQARVEKEIIAITKDTKKCLAYLASYGYNGVSVSNAVKRKALVSQLLKGK